MAAMGSVNTALLRDAVTRQHSIDFRDNTQLNVSKKRVVAQPHELAQRCGQKVGLAARLQRAQRQSTVAALRVIACSANRIIGCERNGHMRQ